MNIKCTRCGKTRNAKVFPLRCNCGLQTNEDGSTVSLRNHELGDKLELAIDRTLTKLGLRKPRRCGCEGRKQLINRWSRRAHKAAWIAAAWVHPR